MNYFAYASNLNHKQMFERCPNCKPLFTATLPNHTLIFTGWSRKWRGAVATIRPLRDGKVMGAVYDISERDLKVLDGHEGYPSVYDRINVFVFSKDGEPVEAVTYIKKEQAEETEPSQEYLAVIQQGYRDWRLA